MPSRTSWRHLLPGIAAIAVVVSIAAAVLLFAGVGEVHGRTMRVYALSSQAQGVIGGTEVWLSGQKIGTVERVEFQPPSTDTSARVVLVLEVTAKAAGQIRHNSTAQIGIGGSLVGPAIVRISAGTPDGAPVGDGDTLRATPQSDVAIARPKLDEAVDNLGPVVADVKTIMALWKRRDGTGPAVRSLVEQHDGEVAELRGNVSRLRAFGAFGALGAQARDVASRAHGTLARVDTIRALLAADRSSIGRWRRDSTLPATVASIRLELDSLRAAMQSVHGNVGRLGRDSAITFAIAAARREMALLFEDMRRRPSRYIAF